MNTSTSSRRPPVAAAPRRAALALALLGTLQGCASTEELYAQYDDQFCRVVMEPAPAAALPEPPAPAAPPLLAAPPAAASPATAAPAASPPAIRYLVVRERATGETMVWSPAVRFGLNSAELTSRAKVRLRNDVAVLEAYPGMRVGVRGYADAVGPVEYNRALSARRADSVVRFLVSAGVSRDRIEVSALGEDMPLENAPAEAAVPINRRVELLLLESGGEPVPLELEEPDEAEAVTGEPPFAAARGAR